MMIGLPYSRQSTLAGARKSRISLKTLAVATAMATAAIIGKRAKARRRGPPRGTLLRLARTQPLGVPKHVRHRPIKDLWFGFMNVSVGSSASGRMRSEVVNNMIVARLMTSTLVKINDQSKFHM